MSLSDVRDGSNQDYFYQEGFRKEASTESPESDQDYYYQEGFRERHLLNLLNPTSQGRS